MEGDLGAELLTRVNALLLRVGYERAFESLDSLTSNASSLLVAVHESIFAPLTGIERRPPTGDGLRAAYAHNAQRVIDSLMELLPPRVVFPASVTGESIASGDLPSLAFLVSILSDASMVLSGASQLRAARDAPLTPEARSALVELGESHLATATTAAGAVSAVASPLKPSTAASEQENEQWLAAGSSEQQAPAQEEAEPSAAEQAGAAAAAAPAPASTDIWAGKTPEKVREKAAVKTALVGGLTGNSAGGSASGQQQQQQQPQPLPTKGAAAAPPPVPAVSSPVKRPAASKPSATIAPSPLAPLPMRPTTATATSTTTTTTSGAPPLPPRSPRRSSVAPSLPSQSSSAGGSSSMMAELAALDERRAQAVAAMSIRRHAGVVKRMAHQNQEELRAIEAMTSAAIRSREAAARVAEEKAVRAAAARTSAAKHERKVVTLRARGAIENMMRATLSMRIARSSRQQAASAAMLKTLAAQARLGAAEELKAAAGARSSMLLGAQGRLAWLNHTARLMNEAVLEETARQVEQRRTATLAQRDALEKAMRGLALEEAAVLAKMQQEQAHAEDAFLAQRVEPLARAAENREGLSVVRALAADPTDTDLDAAKVRTMRRVQAGLGRAEVARGESVRLATQAMGRGAQEAGLGEAQAQALVEQAQGLMTARR